VNPWLLTYDGFDPDQEGLREALCTLGNGYFASRGALAESSADGVHYPGTYVAGLFNRLSSEIGGRTVENESIVNVPNWLPLRFRLTVDGTDGPWIDEHTAEMSEHQVQLDVHRGVLTRFTRFVDDAGRVVQLTQRRLVSMASPHLAAMESTLVVEGFDGAITIESALDGTVANCGVARYRDLPTQHLEPEATHVEDDGSICLAAATNQSKVRVALAARTRVHRGGTAIDHDIEHEQRPGWVASRHTLAVSDGDSFTVEKVATLFTGRDDAITDPSVEACELARKADGFDGLLRAHVTSWRHLWNRVDLEVGANHDAAQLLHLHLYHSLSTISPHTALLDAGVPARGLHGEAYRGHIFWDELFVFPFFSLRMPELTRSLLLYRYRRLDRARRDANAAGYQGAMYPWQSGSNGREETQTVHLNPKSGRWLPDASHLQRHVNAAIAYNVWQYHQATGDEEFLRSYGAEMLVEIARFWASTATYDRARDRWSITGVMGPDEYHEGYPDRDEPGLVDNAYTNVMAVWCLCRAIEVLEVLPHRSATDLRERLEITDVEIARWDDVSTRMRICFHDAPDGSGPVISQFDGFEKLAELDWDAYRERYGDIARLDRILEAEGDTPNRYQVSKQADVLMLFYLLTAEELGELFERLGYGWDGGLIPRSIEYYETRTSHGSTLSRVVQSWLYARRDRERSWDQFSQALHSDVSDVQGGTTPEGIHLGAMAGTIDLVQRCYTGIELRGDALRLNPALPSELGRLAFSLRYRDHSVYLEVTDSQVQISLATSTRPPIDVEVCGDRRRLGPGESATFDLT
jgi:alpha,alpha-trehalase